MQEKMAKKYYATHEQILKNTSICGNIACFILSFILRKVCTKGMIHRTNKVYYSVCLHVEASQNALKEMQDNLQKWFRNKKEGVLSLIVYKYYGPGFKLAIT